MPNWNVTDVKVTGPKEQIDKLYSIMSSLSEADEPAVDNGFGNIWYGCLVSVLDEDWEKVYCRGSWSDLEKIDDNTLSWWDETAWNPLTEVFDVIEKHFPDLKVYWICEEPGMAIYASNDVDHKFFNTRFIFFWDNGEEYEYFDSEEELLDFANDILSGKLEKTVKSLDELDKYIEDSDDICYYQYKYE